MKELLKFTTFSKIWNHREKELIARHGVFVEFRQDLHNFDQFEKWSGPKIWSIRGKFAVPNFTFGPFALLDCPWEYCRKISQVHRSFTLVSYHGNQVPEIDAKNFWGIKIVIEHKNPFRNFSFLEKVRSKYSQAKKLGVFFLNSNTQSLRLIDSLNNDFTFVRMNLESSSHPAQARLEDVLHWEKTAHIKKRAAIVGSSHSLDRSFSLRFHRKYLDAYDRLEFENPQDFLEFLKFNPYEKLSITNPLKTSFTNLPFNTVYRNTLANTDLPILENILDCFPKHTIVLGGGAMGKIIKSIRPEFTIYRKASAWLDDDYQAVINTWPAKHLPQDFPWKKLRKIPLKLDLSYGKNHWEISKRTNLKFKSGIGLFIGQALGQKFLFKV